MQIPTSSYPKAAGILVGVTHALIVAMIALNIDTNAQIWVWMIFFVVDFPVSFLTTAGLDIMRNSWGVVFQNDWKSDVYHYWPIFVHGVLGSIWWYYLSVLFTRFLLSPSKSTNEI